MSLACLLFFATLVQAQNIQDVEVEVLTPFSQIKSGTVLSLVVRFDNTASENISFEPTLSLPEAWRLLIPLGTLNLAAGQGLTIPFSVVIPKNSLAGDYELRLTLPTLSTEEAIEESFAVKVVAIEELQLRAVQKPDFVVEESYTIEYLVLNNGNQSQDFTFAIKDALGYNMSLEPTAATLAPQESTTLLLTVAVPEVDRQRSHDTTLIVSTDNRQVDSLRTRVDLIPQTLSADLLWHFFPVQLSLRTDLNTGRSQGIDSLLSNLDFSLRGSGQLYDEDPGRLNVIATSTFSLSSPTIFAEYRHPSFVVSAGKFSKSLGRLLGTTSTWGAAIANDWDIFETITIENQLLINTNGEFGFGISPTFFAGTETPLELSFAALTSVNQATSEQNSTSIVNSAASSVLHPTALSTDAINTDIVNPATVAVSNTETDNPTKIATSLNFRPRDNRFSLRTSYIYELATSVEPAAGALSFDSTLRWDAHRLTANFDHKQLGYQRAIHSTMNYGVNYYHFNSDLDLNFNAFAKGTTNLSQEQNNQSFGFNLRGNYNRIAWLLGSSFYFKDFGNDQSGYSLRAQTTIPLFENDAVPTTNSISSNIRYSNSIYTTQNLVWEQSTKVDTSSQQRLSYQGDLVFPLSESTFRTGLSGSYNFTTEAIDQFGLSANYGLNIKPYYFNIGANYSPFSEDLLTLKTKGTTTFNTGNQLSIETGTSFFNDKDPSISLSLSSRWFLDVPINQLSSVGQVSGTLKRSNGDPIANTVVEVSGSKVVTQGDGSFNFPVVPAGQAFFRIPSSELANGQMTNPPSPYVFEVVAKEQYQLDFVVLETASLKGKFIYDAQDDSQTVQANVVERDIVAGIIVVLIHSDGTAIRREISNSSGNFEFLSLLPGEWTVTIRHSLADDQYKVLFEDEILVLSEGERGNLEVVIEPIRRPIQFIDGGTVGSN